MRSQSLMRLWRRLKPSQENPTIKFPLLLLMPEVEARSEQKQESAQAKAVMGTSLNRDGATIAELDAFAGQDQQTADAAAVAEDATHKQFATNAEEKKTSLSASESHNYGPQLVTAFQSAGAKLAGIAVGIGRAAIYGPVIVLSTIALFVFFGDRILAFSSHLLNGPQGTVYLSSPGVYTRERLVNDRNDQDYWLRNQLTVLDKFNLEYSELSKTKRALSSADKRRTPDTLGDPSSDANLLMNEGMSPGALVAPNLVDTPKREETGIDDVPTLSFIDTFTIRSAARDAIRQAMLENLLDDRHDLTGNSVYGLRFDTSVFPGKYTSGRAYVHLTVRIKNDQLGSKEQLLNGGVPLHVASYYNHPARDLERNEGNPFYNSRQLYKRWLDNVKWRLDTYFQELAEKKCQCDVDACKIDNWEQEIITSVSDVLAMSGASINSQDFPSVPSKDEAFRLVTLDLPDPWENLLRINVANYYSSNCGLLPSFDVLEVRDIVFILEKKTRRPEYYALAEYSDTEELFVFQPKKAENNKKKGYSEVHYQPYEIAQFLYNNKKKLSCFENKRFNSCDKYIDVPAGYFNFIEKVIDTDMFAYSIFPRMDGTAVFSKANENFGLGATLPSTESTFSLDLDHTSSSNRVEPTFVGFADSEAKGTIEFGWVIEIPRAGQAFQKSQFALISVPAWTSQLEITAEVGWLENSTGKRLKSKEPYKF
ncbi:MAG: hypothetical protein KL863_08875 [Rhizobium sp.]|nr:hypothetical protein [Rhizobium sp.]